MPFASQSKETRTVHFWHGDAVGTGKTDRDRSDVRGLHLLLHTRRESHRFLSFACEPCKPQTTGSSDVCKTCTGPAYASAGSCGFLSGTCLHDAASSVVPQLAEHTGLMHNTDLEESRPDRCVHAHLRDRLRMSVQKAGATFNWKHVVCAKHCLTRQLQYTPAAFYLFASA